MEDINFNKVFISNLERLSTSDTNSEGTFYFYDTFDGKMLIKIIKDPYNRYTQIGLKNIKTLREHSVILSTAIPEFVLPEALVYIDKTLRGYIMQYVKGTTLSDYLQNSAISLEKKLTILKKIGKTLERIFNFKEIPYKLILGDLHENNIIITNDEEIKIIDLNGMCLNPKDIPNCKYLNIAVDELRWKRPKYEINIIGEVVPSENTDIFCYGMIIMNFISQSEFVKLPYYKIREYLNYLKTLGFRTDLINCIAKLYNLDKNENPYPYIEGISEEMIKNASMKVYCKNRNL